MDARRIAEFAERATGARALKAVPLAGDASARRYFRVFFEDGGSVVVMAAPDEESAAAFSEMTGLMRRLGADTPSILGAQGALLALEDLGDKLLQRAAAEMGEDELMAVYRRVIDDLAAFQDNAAGTMDRRHPCFRLAFDEEKLMWEAGFTGEHFLRGYLGARLSAEDESALDAEWRHVASKLAERMETLAHRDFHSRNIMLKEERLVWIDYQDARMGRRLYDLASLLYDPYVELGREARGALADYYYRKLSDKDAAPWGRGEFSLLLDFSAAQRIYKALGTYGYQSSVMGSRVYEEYIPRASRTLMEILETVPALAPLHRLLRGLLPS
ncbi:MAG: aminoglycoside phosphotransferase family protein [Candidatus Nitrospinota bacterium M3_3B_026]